MNQSDKKKKFVNLLSEISRNRKQQADKDLAEHTFFFKQIQEKGSLFDYLIFRAIMEQTDNLSLVFGKPHQYQVLENEEIRLGKEVEATFEKSSLLRATRIGPLTLIG